jgi:hypothetical protein
LLDDDDLLDDGNYVVRYSRIADTLRATFVFKPLALMGRYSLPIFAAGSLLSATGQVIVEERPEALLQVIALDVAIVRCGILPHYLVARGCEMWGRRQPVSAIPLRSRRQREVTVPSAPCRRGA